MADPTPTPVLADWKVKYGPLIWRLFQYALVALAGAVGTWLGVPPKVVEVTKEVLVAEADPTADVNHEGWTPDAEASDRDARNAVFATFADTPAGQVADVPREVFLWQAETKLTGKPAPAKDQNPTGSCVGFGDTTGAERSLAADIVFRGGRREEFTHFSEEVTYAGGKVIGARALGASVSRQDGSATVFTKAFFAAGYGMVPKAKYGSIDMTEYSAARAASWNTSGPPKELLEVSKKFPVNSLAKVTNWEQGKKALASGYALGMDSNLSATAKRDANGIATETREGWSHCMCVDGYTSINGKEFGHVENSWSNIPDQNGVRSGRSFHTGPTGPGNPSTAGFWISADSLDRAFRQGGTFAISGVTGFPARKLPPLDWAARPARNDLFANLPGGLRCDLFSLAP